MTAIDDVRKEFDTARADLLDALDGVTQEEFDRVPPPVANASGEDEAQWSMVEVLWHVGHTEDRLRRTIDQAIDGRTLTEDAPRTRPAHLVTPELLIAWIDQARRPTDALLRRMTDDHLDLEFVRPNGSTRTPRWVLQILTNHDREHAQQVRALRALPAE